MSDKRMSSEDRKCFILEAVTGLFCRKGMNVTSKELSEAAGVSEALIFRHFGSKEGLYKAILEITCHAHDDIGNELTEMEPSSEVLACATYLLLHIIFVGMETGEKANLTTNNLNGLVMQSLQTDGDIARTLFGNGLGPWIKHYEKSMRASQKAGDFVKNSTSFENLVWLTHHTMMGVNMTLHPSPDAYMGTYKDKEQIFEDTLMFCLRGMGMKQEAIERSLKSNTFKTFKKRLSQGA